ncbi:dynamin family protein [Helicobacter macacae]|uniref:Dynamin N-terminal domain-containing protein n=1 Tax=Helicobacter macacae MIT 99-5501 TaxID=1357400 RepID=V8C635_9HELI|nr:dynamin family protein [Helicobacter macacae]ETD22878.1 hypothetical protein HMPREF2086_01677 [Helicobacter macacae MIT 99-5501]
MPHKQPTHSHTHSSISASKPTDISPSSKQSKQREKLWQDFCAVFYPSSQNSTNHSAKSIQITQNAQELAIILSANTDNFDTFCQSKIFINLIQNFWQETDFKRDFELDFDTLQATQKHILFELSAVRLVALAPHFLRLNSANLLSTTHTRTLLALFENFAKEQNNATKEATQSPAKTLNLKALQNELDSLIKQLNTIGISNPTALSQIQQKSANQSFSIGITGVLSAGKSTFLNALLGREILGTSTIPETANLSILRPIFENADKKEGNSTKDFARVHFWSKQEWGGFENDLSDKNMSEFVKSTKEAFGNELESLLEQGSKDIDLGELRDYTSANSSTKYCNLIKKVELFIALPFLQNKRLDADSSKSSNGVEIVDTPGLDDPIRAREKITREFITHCDLLIHIMNASCAATEVDMDFILECLLRSNVARLLVVLSRADLLSPKELESSLYYTRASLAKELTKARFDGDIDALLSRIDFIPISSYFALGYTSNNAQIIAQASAKGYDKEKTGILAVQDYLDNALLGENSQKQRDILYRAYRAVGGIVKEEIEKVGIELCLSYASKDELESVIKDTKAKQEAIMQGYEAQKAEFSALGSELESYLAGLQKIITTNLNMHKNRLNSLVYDDMLYEISRGSVPKKERVSQLLEVGIDDISADLLREYRYKSAQKIASLKASIQMIDFMSAQTLLVDSKSGVDSADYSADSTIKSRVESKQKPKFDSSDLFSLNAKEHLSHIKSTLISSVYAVISSYKSASKSTLEVDFRNALDSALKSGFASLSEIILENNAAIKSAFLSEFEEILEASLKATKAKVALIEETIAKSLEAIKNTDIESLKSACANKDKALKDIQNELEIIIKALQ